MSRTLKRQPSLEISRRGRNAFGRHHYRRGAVLRLVDYRPPGDGMIDDALLSSDDPRPIDDVLERAGLDSSEVLARPFHPERKGLVASIAGKTVPQDIIVGTGAL